MFLYYDNKYDYFLNLVNQTDIILRANNNLIKNTTLGLNSTQTQNKTETLNKEIKQEKIEIKEKLENYKNEDISDNKNSNNHTEL